MMALAGPWSKMTHTFAIITVSVSRDQLPNSNLIQMFFPALAAAEPDALSAVIYPTIPC